MVKKNVALISIIIIIALVSVTAVSGCIEQVSDAFSGLFGTVKSVFGMEVIKPSRQSVTVGIVNPIVISRAWTLPSEKTIPDASMQMYMEITDKDLDPEKPASNLIVNLFDASIFKTPEKDSKTYCNTKPEACYGDRCNPNSPCEFKMGATKQLLFNFRSPSAADIASVITTAKLNYKLNYDYRGTTNYEILVVDYNEIIKRQREGQTLATSLQDTRGSGPIKIDAELMTPYVVTAEDPKNAQSAYIVFKIRNAGSGMLKDSRIAEKKLEIRFPMSLVGADWNGEKPNFQYNKQTNNQDCAAEFSCSAAGNDLVCTNVKCIELFRGESETFSFKINSVPYKGILGTGIPHRAMLITAAVSYNYELRGSLEVVIDPSLKR